MAHHDRRPHYHVYLVRLWRETGAQGDEGPWRFSLELPHTRERYGFTSIMALAEFLRRTVGALDGPGGTGEAGEGEEGAQSCW